MAASERDEGVPGYLLLKDGSIHPASEGEPVGLHVAGRLVRGRFAPEGDVIGDGPLGGGGQPGWMELGDGSFHAQHTARPPFPPYVEGGMRATEGFVPTTRRVRY